MPPEERRSRLSHTTSGTQASTRPNVPTPLARLRAALLADIRTACFFPALACGSRRTSIRLDGFGKSGRRRLVFSFFLAQSALVPDCLEHLPIQILRPFLDYKIRRGRFAVNRQAINRLYAPPQIQPFDL